MPVNNRFLKFHAHGNRRAIVVFKLMILADYSCVKMKLRLVITISSKLFLRRKR